MSSFRPQNSELNPPDLSLPSFIREDLCGHQRCLLTCPHLSNTSVIPALCTLLSEPRVFTKVLAPVLVLQSSNGILIVGYLDYLFLRE